MRRSTLVFTLHASLRRRSRRECFCRVFYRISLRTVECFFSAEPTYQIITIFEFNKLTVFIMNLQSPTSLLSSIQSMRDRLRTDKELLSDIKHDFTKLEKKKRPQPIETILEESVQDPSMSISKGQSSYAYASERQTRNKALELKKEHQKELARLRQEHQKETQQLVQNFTKEKEQLEQKWKAKVQEQVQYITFLEEQVSSPNSPIQTERENASQEQYDTVINKLLVENTRLHQQLQQARDESEHWRRQARTLWTEVQAKSKSPLFSKSNKQKLSKPQRETNNIKQVESVYADENEDRSNLVQTWSDIEIQSDEGKLKTIKQFPLGLSQCEKSGVGARLR